MADVAAALNRSLRGGYVLRDPGPRRDVTLLAAGSEVAIAAEAADPLEAEGLAVAVVSVPCHELFLEQPAAYRAAVLGVAPRVAVEAAVSLSWDRFLRESGRFIGMRALAPRGPRRRSFGITAAAVAAAARDLA